LLNCVTDTAAAGPATAARKAVTVSAAADPASTLPVTGQLRAQRIATVDALLVPPARGAPGGRESLNIGTSSWWCTSGGLLDPDHEPAC
jgi:hypothetical protein